MPLAEHHEASCIALLPPHIEYSAQKSEVIIFPECFNTKSRTCACGCGKQFVPSHIHQIYYSKKHQIQPRPYQDIDDAYSRIRQRRPEIRHMELFPFNKWDYYMFFDWVQRNI